eukprot:2643400-Prymnesium_polylepis.1
MCIRDSCKVLLVVEQVGGDILEEVTDLVHLRRAWGRTLGRRPPPASRPDNSPCLREERNWHVPTAAVERKTALARPGCPSPAKTPAAVWRRGPCALRGLRVRLRS